MQVLWKPQRDKHTLQTRSSVSAYFSVLPAQSIKILICWLNDTGFSWKSIFPVFGNGIMHKHRIPFCIMCPLCWRGQVFYCLLKQSHRMLCGLQFFNGTIFLLAKVHYHLSKIKTELNMTVLVARIKTVLFKERHKQTHWPEVQPWEQQAAPRAHVRSQHQQMILRGMVIFLAFV